jgi:putative methionine-R-sulfoxide reductase with GAF domain
MHGYAQPEDRFPPVSAGDMSAETTATGADRTASVGENSNRNHVLEETELNSALQLLVERAQYITGATGSALALPQGEEMVCRASAGSSAPALGARLQVRSGLTGESIARRQLLRCDNAEADPRVNLETCRALGIASIVVLPLLRRDGEVRGLFELFSDHPYAFEERDLIALERMADLTLTALDLAEQRQNSVPAPTPRQEPEKPVESHAASSARPASVIPLHPVNALVAEPTVVPSEVLPPTVLPAEVLPPGVLHAEVLTVEPVLISSPGPASVPEAMRRVQKCTSCGFPVSEGRTLCLDCEKKDVQTKQRQKEQGQAEHRVEQQAEQQVGQQKTEQDKIVQQKIGQQKIGQGEQELGISSASIPPSPEEFVPAFLANATPVSESWMANHVNLLAIIVLILGILVAVVVFR